MANPIVDAWSAAQVCMRQDHLRTKRFEAAWRQWVLYRRARRSPLTQMTLRRQIRMLEGYGHDEAIATINQSMDHGWLGLFAPRAPKGEACKREYAEPTRDVPRL